MHLNWHVILTTDNRFLPLYKLLYSKSCINFSVCEKLGDLGLNKYSCIIIWNSVVTAVIFLHLRWQRKNTHRGSFPAFLDRAIWYTLSKVVLQPQRSPYSLRAIIAVVISGMPRSTSCATKCKATLQVQWETHTWKSPYVLYGLALNVSLGGGRTVYSMKLPIFSKVRHCFQAFLLRGNPFKP